ncbi:MAG TPA: hypothetical protein VK129_02115 [Terriglobales bacterium]|nr:hypothetical protein [Terriglobales bacterium]
MTTERRQLHLSAELCAAAEERFGKNFASLEDLLEFVLRELLRDEAMHLDQAEQRIVEERLKDLGYI